MKEVSHIFCFSVTYFSHSLNHKITLHKEMLINIHFLLVFFILKVIQLHRGKQEQDGRVDGRALIPSYEST